MPPDTVPEQVKDILTAIQYAHSIDSQLVDGTKGLLNIVTDLSDELKRVLPEASTASRRHADYLTANADTLLKDITYDEYQTYRKQLKDARSALSYKKLTFDDTIRVLLKQYLLISKYTVLTSTT